MAVKSFVLLCVQTLLIQSALSRCLAPIDSPCGCSLPASSGGSFVVTSSSPVAPTGVTIVSENVYEGALVAGGNLPMLGSVGVEGSLGNAGAGAVSYGCGDDVAAIVEEGPIVTGIVAPVVAPLELGPGFAPYFGGYGFGFGYPGFGFGYPGFGFGFPGFGFGYPGYGFGYYGCC